ncbi:MAG TPA: methyl-coenzyme M reductase operon protein D [Methanomassiliicoccales archaeon]|nr:methyl-coenzyme M reductase operon protein D [Methanomassiliicoccales archaeon]
MSDISTEPVPLPEIMIFPKRLLNADTTEKLLNRIHGLKHVRQINLHGESLPVVVNYGPGKGHKVDHPQRRVIEVKGEKMELRVQVGRIFVEVDDIDYVQEVSEEIERICEETLPFDFYLEVGRYSKFKPSLTDYLRGLR